MNKCSEISETSALSLPNPSLKQSSDCSIFKGTVGFKGILLTATITSDVSFNGNHESKLEPLRSDRQYGQVLCDIMLNVVSKGFPLLTLKHNHDVSPSCISHPRPIDSFQSAYDAPAPRTRVKFRGPSFIITFCC